jgi:hypothetical protein
VARPGAVLPHVNARPLPLRARSRGRRLLRSPNPLALASQRVRSPRPPAPPCAPPGERRASFGTSAALFEPIGIAGQRPLAYVV